MVSKVHLEIDNAVRDWQDETGKPKAELARLLDVDKAVLSRRLNGTSNMTIKTIADLAWAIGREIEFSLRPHCRGRRKALSPVGSVLFLRKGK
ncbi:MAG: helix-turn-helix transcriptional regulator [Magnetospirillum sp. WYHS-4]